MSIEDKIKEIISKVLSVDVADVTEDASFVDDLGADSLDLVNLIMTMEDEFGIRIEDEEAEKIKFVKDAVAFVKTKQ